MDKNIIELLDFPKEVEERFIDSLRNISIDDGKNEIEIIDECMLERFYSAQLLSDDVYENKQNIEYPLKVGQNVVYLDELALNLDNISASYSATKKELDCFRSNITLSTVDALYVNSAQEWFLIEFKNGNWDKEEIRNKCYETRNLLDDLKVLDEKAIVTTNREKENIIVEGLKLSEKIEKVLKYERTSEFYREHVNLVVVYSADKKISERYAKLCGMMDKHNNLCQILEDSGILENNRITKKNVDVRFGNEAINDLAKCLLASKVVNQNFRIFDEVLKADKRFDDIDNNTSGVKKYIRKLEKYPEIMENVLAVFYKDANKDIINRPKEFLKYIAARSIRGYENERLSYERDDYEIVEDLLKIIDKEQYDKFHNKISSIIELFEEKKALEKEFDVEFTEQLEGMLKNDFNNALKRIMLIYRLNEGIKRKPITGEQMELLLHHVLGMEDKEAKTVVERMNKETEDEKMTLFLDFVAVYVYLKYDSNVRRDARYDKYYHIVRQLEYYNEFTKRNSKEESGKKDDGKKDYGFFAESIYAKISKYKIENKRDMLKNELQRVERKIFEGKSFHEIYPFTKAIKLFVDPNPHSIKWLRDCLEGSVVKSVKGCWGPDFCVER